ncbi:MAG TPA: hypothetical protein VFP50_08730 [Anaeromyxobacteraceae bacterium]|nr:hypothetical protein [Anaeromyxobacteraceae bacterium]
MSPSAATCLAPADLAGADAPGVVDGPALLGALLRGEPLPPLDVAVVLCSRGGGLECARALNRRGLSVTLVCRCDGGDPFACDAALEAARREGIEVERGARPAEVIRRGGRARWLRLVRQRPGDEFVLPADLVVVPGPERA